MPVSETTPVGTTRRWAWVARSTSPGRAPAPTETRREPGSTSTSRSSPRSSTTPPSTVAKPATLWPPPRTARGSLRSRAERLSRDPLQQLLLFVGLYEEALAGLTEPYPGCLLATTIHEAEPFDEETHRRVRRSVRIWRERVGAKLREVAETRPPKLAVDLDVVADRMWSTFEGALILSNTTGSPSAVADQLRQYRNYLELLFGD